MLNAARRCVGLLAVFCGMTAAQAAPIIGVNFTGGGASVAPGDQPGVVPGANFTNVTGGQGTSVLNLQDSTGAVTTASLLINTGVTYGGFGTPATSNAGTNKMYSGGLVGDGSGGPNSEIKITFTGIPYGAYDVYVYASADTPATNTLSNSIGGTTYYYASGDPISGGVSNLGVANLLLTTSTDPLNPTLGPAQYQRYTGLTGSSFTLTTTGSISGVLSNNVFGIQIVALEAVPEPASLAVAGLIAAGCALTARRRKRAAELALD